MCSVDSRIKRGASRLARNRRGFPMLWRRLIVILRDWHPSPKPKRPAGDLQSRSRLPAFVLASIDQFDDAQDDGGINPSATISATLFSSST